jgi:membrane associated rhomboid family serine protease
VPKHEPADDLKQVVRWLAVLWAIELIDHVVTPLLVRDAKVGQDGLLDMLLGLHPWDPHHPFWPQLGWGVVGMICAPLLHGGWYHLIQNSLALGLLGYLSLRFSNHLTWAAVGYATVCSAVLTWLIAPPDQVHVGASGVIFGLVGFLMANGIVRRGCLPIVLALVVLVLYGGALVGMLPQASAQHISWQMHLGGFIGGLCAAWHLRHEKE